MLGNDAPRLAEVLLQTYLLGMRCPTPEGSGILRCRFIAELLPAPHPPVRVGVLLGAKMKGSLDVSYFKWSDSSLILLPCTPSFLMPLLLLGYRSSALLKPLLVSSRHPDCRDLPSLDQTCLFDSCQVLFQMSILKGFSWGKKKQPKTTF